jgi:hypothetical protein
MVSGASDCCVVAQSAAYRTVNIVLFSRHPADRKQHLDG